MKRLLILSFLLACWGSGGALAANVELTRGNGLPGDLVTLILGVDDVPVDSFGAFSLDLELKFNPDRVRYVTQSVRKIDIFEEGFGPGMADFVDVQEDFNPTNGVLFLNLLSSYSSGAPASGNLISLDFLIATDSANGEVPIELKIVSSVNNALNSAGDSAISVSVVPIPPALLLFIGPLAWMLARGRRG